MKNEAGIFLWIFRLLQQQKTLNDSSLPFPQTAW